MEIQTTSNEVIRRSVIGWNRMSHITNPHIAIDHRFGGLIVRDLRLQSITQ
jgi:hypothetical protein